MGDGEAAFSILDLSSAAGCPLPSADYGCHLGFALLHLGPPVALYFVRRTSSSRCLRAGYSYQTPLAFPSSCMGVIGVLLLIVGVLALAAAIRAFRGKEFRYPIVGGWLASYLNMER